MDEELKTEHNDLYPDLDMEEYMEKFREKNKNRESRVETSDNYKQELNTLHVQYFRKDLEYLREHIDHYRKLAGRWKRLSLAIKYLNGLLTVIGSIGAILVVSVATLGALTLPLTVAFAGMGVASNIGDNGFNLITSRKLKKV